MKRIAMVLVVGILAGCGGDKADNKTPKLSGTPDSKIQGPAGVGTDPGPAGKGNKGGKAATSVD